MVYKADQEILKENINQFQKTFRMCKQAFWIIFFFAFAINFLMLITPLYSLQVLDRVIGSGNLSTLLMLSLIIGLIYFVYGLLQIARSFTLIRIGQWLDNNISQVLFSHSISSSILKSSINAGQILRDFQTVKVFLTSTGINTILDIPWTIAYIIVVFMIHRYMGYVTLIGGAIIVILAFINAIATNKTLGEATEYNIKSMHKADLATRNAEVIEAMGMMKNVSYNWHEINKLALNKQSEASYRNGIVANISRFVRNIIQMCVTGTGAYVVVSSKSMDMTTGGMIASSIFVGKALAPFDNFIELYKQIVSAFKAYNRINDSFKTNLLREDAMSLTDISGKIVVEDLYYVSKPQNNDNTPIDMSKMLSMFAKPRYILQGVSFSVEPGEILAIIGHSASGKTSLARLLTGIWEPTSGSIRLDGAEVYKWNRIDFGKHIGYVPQGIELFTGSVKENIARMSPDIDNKKIIEAAKFAGAHEMILQLPEGYDSDIGIAGSKLSGGQKQRIALARAFYDNPKLLILDEPNANLDELGEKALAESLLRAKELSMSVIVVSHRQSILSVVDKILVLQGGKVMAYGPKEQFQTNPNVS